MVGPKGQGTAGRGRPVSARSIEHGNHETTACHVADRRYENRRGIESDEMTLVRFPLLLTFCLALNPLFSMNLVAAPSGFTPPEFSFDIYRDAGKGWYENGWIGAGN